MKYTGWLSPTGELVKCDEYGHLDKAMRLVKAMGIETKRPADDILRAYGWVRISFLTYQDVGLAFWMPKTISPEQRHFLQEVIADENITLSQQGVKAIYGYRIY